MDIGKPQRTWEVEPAQEPFKRETPNPVRRETPQPEREPVKTPERV